MPEKMSEDMSERMSEDTGERMPESISEDFPETCQKICQKECQQKCEKIRRLFNGYAGQNVKKYARRFFEDLQEKYQKICQKERHLAQAQLPLPSHSALVLLSMNAPQLCIPTLVYSSSPCYIEFYGFSIQCFIALPPLGGTPNFHSPWSDIGIVRIDSL